MILENKINLLTEKINSSEFIISEMKKIGIEKLPYSQSSLKRFIDSKTMDVHYNGHYKTYVKKLNDALSKKNYGDVDLEDIIKSISKYDEKIRNNAGGAFNHALFWKMLSPEKQEIPKEIKSKIIKDFDSTIEFKKQFGEVAKERFGSGWCWLILTKGNKLKIMSTPNQDNPLMNVVKDGGFPLLGLDLWEHAYYLKYQNKRDEYIKNFWDVVNWDFVNQLYLSKLKTKLSESVKTKRIIIEQENEWIEPSENPQPEMNVEPENIDVQSKIDDTKTKKEKTSKPFQTESNFNISQSRMREVIRTQYEPCKKVESTKDGCIGQIKDKNCVTNKGIIGGKYAESNYGGDSEWSIINRWDSNDKVHKKILELYNNRDKYKNISFEEWFRNNIKELFSNDGIYTSTLADVGKKQIEKGSANESYAKNLIKRIYNFKPEEEGITWQIYTNCSGSVNDTRKGQDIVLEYNNATYYFQVKQLTEKDIKIVIDNRGNYYRVNSFHNHQKYKMENVDVIVYVDIENDKYILFANDYDYIQTIPSRSFPHTYYINYYEEPIITNMTIEKTPISPSRETEKELFKKSKEEKYKYYKERFDYYKQKMDELGYSEEINEQIKKYKHKLIKLIRE